MCTLVILRRPDHPWPVLIGANRDEMIGREWKPPGRHWPDRPETVAGLDLLAGGSWLGLNDWGVAAAVLNRHGSLGPAPGLRSRGELVLEALDHADAVDAAGALADLDPAAYRSFNLILADSRDAFWVRHAGDGRIGVGPIKEGLSVIAAGELDDPGIERVALALPRFAATPAPDPDTGDFAGWERLLSGTEMPPGAPPDSPPNAPLRFHLPSGFATVSSAVIALPAAGDPARRPVFRFASWHPEAASWRDLLSAG